MSFEDGKVSSQSSEENLKKKEQRRAAMFGTRRVEEGSSGTNTTYAIYPIGEKVNLPMDLIDEHPDNDSIFNMDFIEELAEVMSDKYYGAIEVYQKPNGRFEILSGHRRFRARKLNNEETIPAIISEPPSEIERAKRLILSNIHNRSLTPLDYARSIDYYIEKVLNPSGFKGDRTKECARVFMKSETHIKRYRAINKMIPQIQALLVSTSFPFTALDGARTFTEEEQKFLYDEIIKFKKQNPDTEISEIYIKQIIHQINVKKGKKSSSEPAKSKENMVRDGLPKIITQPIETKSAKHEQPMVDFSGSSITSTLETDTSEELVGLETVLDTYGSQLKNLLLDNYSTNNREAILNAIYKIQNQLKYLESYFS